MTLNEILLKRLESLRDGPFDCCFKGQFVLVVVVFFIFVSVFARFPEGLCRSEITFDDDGCLYVDGTNGIGASIG
jgi:hypothetical protein